MDLIQFGIIATLILSLLLGLIGGKYIKGKTENFFVAGRKIAFPLVGLALFAQAVDGNATMGNTSLAHDFGFWAGATYPIGLAISLFLLGKFFAPRLHEMKLLTLADFFQKKYNRKIELIASILMLLSFSLLLAGNLATVGILLQMFFGIHYQTAIILVAFAILAYCIAGGIIADYISDTFQVSVFLIGLLLCTIFLVTKFGVADVLFTQEFLSGASLKQMFDPSAGAFVNWATIIALGFGNILAIDFASRIFSAKSPTAAQKGCYFGGILTLIFGLPFAFLPFFIQKSGVAVNGDAPILITFLLNVVPAGISVFLIGGIIAIAISTIDGGLLSMGNILAKNILKADEDANSMKKEEEKSFLYFTRLAMLPVGAFGMIAAILLPSPGVLLTVAFDIMFASLLVPFLAAFFIDKVSEKAAFAAILTGGISRFIFATLTPTSFGVKNPYFYIPNNFVPEIFDGLGTILAPILALVVFMYFQFQYKRKSQKIT
jgi:Na+/proline symporter